MYLERIGSNSDWQMNRTIRVSLIMPFSDSLVNLFADGVDTHGGLCRIGKSRLACWEMDKKSNYRMKIFEEL